MTGALVPPMHGEEAPLWVYSDCGHPPVGAWPNNEATDPKVGEYGWCWCDDERIRRVVMVGHRS